ncbi:hypothetical protein ACVDG8_013665 [Mesorhizobium sp. ORM8.1]
MITAKDIDSREPAGRLRPAEGHALRAASHPAGPFDVAVDASQSSSARDALMTGLLVIYPAFAALAAILAGLFLTGASGA